MKRLALIAASAALFAATLGSAQAGVAYRNLDSLVANTASGGQIIVAINVKCTGGGNFVMQTYRNSNEAYRGCAFLRDDDRLVIAWNDGATVSYGLGAFTRTRSWMNVY